MTERIEELLQKIDSGHKLTKEEHEELVKLMEKEFGKYKKIIVEGKAYRVPLRDIIEKGVKGFEIPSKYPEW